MMSHSEGQKFLNTSCLLVTFNQQKSHMLWALGVWYTAAIHPSLDNSALTFLHGIIPSPPPFLTSSGISSILVCKRAQDTGLASPWVTFPWLPKLVKGQDCLRVRERRWDFGGPFEEGSRLEPESVRDLSQWQLFFPSETGSCSQHGKEHPWNGKKLSLDHYTQSFESVNKRSPDWASRSSCYSINPLFSPSQGELVLFWVEEIKTQSHTCLAHTPQFRASS
jgi:hypothetical protein